MASTLPLPEEKSSPTTETLSDVLKRAIELPLPEEKSPSAIQVLSNFLERLGNLNFSQDPTEAELLLQWLKEGGLRSLEPDLIEHVSNVAIPKPPLLYQFNLRLFTQWKTTSFQAASFSTGADIYETIAKDFKIPKDEFELRIIPMSSLDDYIAYSRIDSHILIMDGPKAIGVTLKNYQGTATVFEIMISPLPPKDQGRQKWYEDSDYEFTVPIAEVKEGKILQKFTSPAASWSTYGEIAMAADNYLRRYTVIEFVRVDPDAFRQDDLFLPLWAWGLYLPLAAS